MATMLLYAAGSIGTGAFYAFNNFVLPPILKSFGAPDLLIGLLSSTRSIEGAVIQPTIGAFSDRVWTRFGRRRPFLMIGIPLSAVFFLAGAFVHSLLPLAGVIFAFSIFFNVAVDPYTALLADIAPLEQRGWLSGLGHRRPAGQLGGISGGDRRRDRRRQRGAGVDIRAGAGRAARQLRRDGGRHTRAARRAPRTEDRQAAPAAGVRRGVCSSSGRRCAISGRCSCTSSG